MKRIILICMALILLVGCSSEVEKETVNGTENISEKTTDLEISNEDEEKEEESSSVHEIVRIRDGKLYPNEIKVDKGTILELEIYNEDEENRMISIIGYNKETSIKKGNKDSFLIEADKNGVFDIDLKNTQNNGKLIIE